MWKLSVSSLHVKLHAHRQNRTHTQTKFLLHNAPGKILMEPMQIQPAILPKMNTKKNSEKYECEKTGDHMHIRTGTERLLASKSLFRNFLVPHKGI